jgi:MFS family permease
VTQPYFQTHFGMLNPDGSANTKKTNDVSSNVVSVLQAGAFFGALGSAPISNWIGRRWTLVIFTLIFSLGAVSIIHPYQLFCLFELTCTQILTTVAGGSRGLSYIYGGRVISGVGIGGISAVAPAYVSECSPKNVRGRITGLFQIMVAIGVMLSYFINCKLSVSGSNGPRV